MAGYVADTGLNRLDVILTRGGIQSMMWTMSLALIALSLGGISGSCRLRSSAGLLVC